MASNSVTATDVAGNTSSASNVVTVSIDKTAPRTAAVPNPPPNAAGWNNQANVAVTLTATDNASGVASTELNLDGAGRTAYAAPVVVSTEGKHLLQYRSVDLAGNVEVADQLPINIDRTAPEASMQFAPTSKDIQVFGHDALSGTQYGSVAAISTVPAKWGRDDDDEELGPAGSRGDDTPRVGLRTYVITDVAGNRLIVVLKVHRTRDQLQVVVVSLRYNEATLVNVAHNAERYAWDLTDENHGDVLRHLEQQVRIGAGKQRQSVQAEFSAGVRLFLNLADSTAQDGVDEERFRNLL